MTAIYRHESRHEVTKMTSGPVGDEGDFLPFEAN